MGGHADPPLQRIAAGDQQQTTNNKQPVTGDQSRGQFCAFAMPVAALPWHSQRALIPTPRPSATEDMVAVPGSLSSLWDLIFPFGVLPYPFANVATGGKK